MLNPEEANQYIRNPAYLSSITELDKKKKLDILASILLDRQKTLDEVVVWARMLFEEYYVRRPAQLIHTCVVSWLSSLFFCSNLSSGIRLTARTRRASPFGRARAALRA